MSEPRTRTKYKYDSSGQRFQKWQNGAGVKGYWFGAGSDVLAEGDVNGNITQEYIFFGGQRIARSDPSNNVVYYLSDHLGTARVSTNSSGSICYDADFYPFGGERIVTDTCDSAYKFTGKERDGESGLDNFGARYDSSQLGRFMSPDPANYGAIDKSPQTWNAYSYVANNPLNATDPDGLDCVYTQNFSETGDVTVERGNCTQKGGTYVDGTIDTKSLTYDSKTNELGFMFSNAEQQTGGAGIISLGPLPNPDSNSGELNPFATGVFTQLNKMPIEKFVGVVYGGSVVIGLTGGAACYYLCPEAATISLAGETGTELIESTNTLNKIIGGPQRELLKEFFKSEGRQVPEGLSNRSLQIYKTIAQRAIAAGKDQAGVQTQRLKWIVDALK